MFLGVTLCTPPTPIHSPRLMKQSSSRLSAEQEPWELCLAALGLCLSCCRGQDGDWGMPGSKTRWVRAEVGEVWLL